MGFCIFWVLGLCGKRNCPWVCGPWMVRVVAVTKG